MPVSLFALSFAGSAWTWYSASLEPALDASAQRDDADIMYPAWAFWEGGPWVSTIKTWQWPVMRERISAAADAAGDWVSLALVPAVPCCDVLLRYL